MTTMRARYEGAMLGLAIGDALGWPVEFMPLAAIRERYGPDGLADLVPSGGHRAGAFTDDTQMSLAIARAIKRYREATDICDNLEQKNRERDAAMKSGQQADEARKAAEKVGAASYAKETWDQGEKERKEAEALNEAADFVKARESWQKAAATFGTAEKTVRPRKDSEEAKQDYESKYKAVAGVVDVVERHAGPAWRAALSAKKEAETPGLDSVEATRRYREATKRLVYASTEGLLSGLKNTSDSRKAHALVNALRELGTGTEVWGPFYDQHAGQDGFWWIQDAETHASAIKDDKHRAWAWITIGEAYSKLGMPNECDIALGRAFDIAKNLEALELFNTCFAIGMAAREGCACQVAAKAVSIAGDIACSLHPGSQPGRCARLATLSMALHLDEAVVHHYETMMNRALENLHVCKGEWRQVWAAAYAVLGFLDKALEHGNAPEIRGAQNEGDAYAAIALAAAKKGDEHIYVTMRARARQSMPSKYGIRDLVEAEAARGEIDNARALLPTAHRKRQRTPAGDRMGGEADSFEGRDHARPLQDVPRQTLAIGPAAERAPARHAMAYQAHPATHRRDGEGISRLTR